MRRYNHKKVMKTAHRFYKSKARTGQSWKEVLEMSWLWEKNNVRLREERQEQEVRVIETLKNREPSGGSNYNDLSIPSSAFYNPHSTGLMGAHYVGD